MSTSIILEATVTHLLLEERASDKGKSIATRRSWTPGLSDNK